MPSSRRPPKQSSAPRRSSSATSSKSVEKSYPKTTRPEASSRREAPASDLKKTGKAGTFHKSRKFDAFPDRIDIRDWVYQPSLSPRPNQIVNCDLVPGILDQGTEGACTGFALAAVVNYLLSERDIARRVSPRMLYEMARRYDEWPGEKYDGSSARGAMKGWIAHGVCNIDSWPNDAFGTKHFTQHIADEAQGTPGGAFYRVSHREIRDLHGAIAEVGIIYATLMVHEGWEEPGPQTRTIPYVQSGNLCERVLPIIQRRGRAESGHAIAIVGYTYEGFIIQNSWGPGWGADGFALLPYEDFLMHTTDVWVAQLGVPIKPDLWKINGIADTRAGVHRATPAIPLSEIRPYVIDIGNNGELSGSGHYWTDENDLERLFKETIPEKTSTWEKKRILLYLHGGLNDETAVARRIVAFRDVMLDNEIYPLHIMWETGFLEALNGLISDIFTDVDERAGGVADWMKKFREGLLEAKDRSLELTAAAPGTMFWKEMKENARLASDHPDDKGGMQLLFKYVQQAMQGLNAEEKQQWELHVVGHSAGSIFAAHAMNMLTNLNVEFKTLQFMAPAITVEEFKDTILPLVNSGKCPHPSLYVLSDIGERDDDVGPYGKSLLFLVSNAFEKRREMPLLGMERFISDDVDKDKNLDRYLDTELNQFFKKEVDGLPSLVVAGKSRRISGTSRSDSHGGFDDDPETLNSILYRVLGQEPGRAFEVRDLQY